MKSNFKFYFRLIVFSGFLSAIIYGLSQQLVEKYLTYFSFGLLGITIIGISGMMRNLTPVSAAKVSAK